MASENFGVFIHATSTRVLDGTEELPVVNSSITKKCLLSDIWASTYVGIHGTTNQIDVTAGAGVITLSTPQNIHTAATPQFARLGLGQAADGTACLGISQSVGATSTDGAILQTSAVAASGAQKFSPRMRWTGQGFATGSSASMPVDWIVENQPLQGSTTPSGNLVFSYQTNSGGYQTAVTFRGSSGQDVLLPTAQFSTTTATTGGNGGFVGALNARHGWSSSSSVNTSSSYDTALSRNAAAVVEVNNGTAGQWGAVKCGVRDSGTNTIINAVTVGHQSTGTPAAGLGSAILFNIDSSTTADQNAARIAAVWTTATHASRTADIVFYNVNNAGALAETARILANGGFSVQNQIAVVGANATLPLQVNQQTAGRYVALFNNLGNTTASQGIYIIAGADSAGGANFIEFYRGTNGSSIGTIQQNGLSAVSYNTSSDKRLKDNIVDSKTGMDTLKKIKVRDFNYKAEPNKKVQGFIAQELYEVYPQAVAVGVDSDLSRKTGLGFQPWGIDYGRLTSLLVRAIQELELKVQALESVIDKLKKSKGK